MLEDTSFAIHPGKENETGGVPFSDIGNLKRIEEMGAATRFYCDRATVAISFYREDIVRVIMEPDGKEFKQVPRAVVIEPEVEEVTRNETDSRIEISTSKMKVNIQKTPFRVSVLDSKGNILVTEGEAGMGFNSNGEVICYKKMHEDDHFYGFGEKSGFLDKRGEKYEMWNTDVYAPHNPETDPLYESIPYFMTLRNGRAHGIFFDNTHRTVFDMKSDPEHYSFMAEGGRMDYYVFAGPDPKRVIEQYTHITGRMPIPPKWAIGYHQSRYSYESEQEVRDLAASFQEKEIPVDVIYLDIHYMLGYRVFTFDKERFSDPAKLVRDLKAKGIRVVPIVDPGVKKDPEYKIYQEGIKEDFFCKYLEGDLYFGDVWPETSVFPDFTDERARQWWGNKHKFYTDMGIEGIWNDMNEPAVFNETKTMDTSVMHKNDGYPDTHRALHNVYGLLMGKSTYEGMKGLLGGKRPFLLTRAGYSGVQRFAAVWTGDNRSFWEHLQMSLPMTMNLGLSGVAFNGPDVGGFAHDANPELLARWTQVGAFTPYFRNHSAIGTHYQEPWQFGEKYEAIIKKYIQLRYKWMPQLYTLFQQAHKTGLPVTRPLLMEYPADPKTEQLHDQFMIGDNVIIAPIMSPGLTDRAVYLPEGDWVDYFNGEEYQGGKMQLVHAELEKMPIFVRKGTALAHGEVVSSMETKQKDMELHLYADDKNNTYHFEFYDDDGETFAYQNRQYMRLDLSLSCSPEEIELRVNEREGFYHPPYKKIKIVLHGVKERQYIRINGHIQENPDNIILSLESERR